MLEQISGYDWAEAFQYAANGHTNAVQGYAGSTEGFDREAVAEIVAISDGENDERSWIALFKLTDGRLAFLSAGCDYTGWGCQDWGHTIIGDDLDTMVRFALGDEERRRLGLESR